MSEVVGEDDLLRKQEELRDQQAQKATEMLNKVQEMPVVPTAASVGDSVAASTAQQGPSNRLFAKDLPAMMYGFGDSIIPVQETVEAMDELATLYIKDLTARAVRVGQKRSHNRLTAEDITIVLRKDPKKFARAQELIYMEKLLTEARSAVDQKEQQEELMSDKPAAAPKGTDEGDPAPSGGPSGPSS